LLQLQAKSSNILAPYLLFVDSTMYLHDDVKSDKNNLYKKGNFVLSLRLCQGNFNIKLDLLQIYIKIDPTT